MIGIRPKEKTKFKPTNMETPAFYNTTGMALSELTKHIEQAKKQDDRVILILKAKGYPMTAHGIHQSYQSWFQNVPITSIRRSLTNLMNSGQVIKCPEMGQGGYGMMTHKWRLA